MNSRSHRNRPSANCGHERRKHDGTDDDRRVLYVPARAESGSVIGDGMVPVPRDDPDYDELLGMGRETPIKNERFRNSRMTAEDIERVREILATVKLLAAEYYRLTGKPLGVTGEVAEYVAADKLGPLS
jgi:hypothetical protein